VFNQQYQLGWGEMSSFFAELKRRNVFKVGAAYAIVAWLLIQVASILFPTFNAPDWVMQVFTVVILLGFPVALVLAWAYELTPEGIKPANEVQPDQSMTAKTSRKFNFPIAGLFMGAVVSVGLFWLFTRYETQVESQEEVQNIIQKHDEPDALISAPPGARVLRRAYDDSGDNWEVLGITPLENLRLPRDLSQLRFELDGYEPVLRTQLGLSFGGVFSNETMIRLPPVKLDTSGSLPDGMVRVPGWTENVAG
jgi:hypothetical protein